MTPVPGTASKGYRRRVRGGRCSHTQCSDCRTKRGWNYGRRRIRRSERRLIERERP